MPAWEIEDWPIERDSAFLDIEPLSCLSPMVWYYRRVRASIRHLAGDPKYDNPNHLASISYQDVRALRRAINTDLLSYSVEFYLQRRKWALEAVGQPTGSAIPDWKRMRAGFARENVQGYTYERFFAQTHTAFDAIHSHLVSINRAISHVYYFVTELPFATFTDVGKSEILHLTSELDRVMTGLLVATHLQPRASWQSDLPGYLVSSRVDCQRLLDTIPRYYHSHRMRLVIFPTNPPEAIDDPYKIGHPHEFPLTCLPWTAGVYLDFLVAFRGIVQHSMAVIQWSIRLYSLWYFLPRRFKQMISPFLRPL